MKVTAAKEKGRHGRNSSSSKGDTTRTMTPIELDCVSTSFRRICLRDFRGVVDNYHSESQRQYKDTDLFKFAVRVNDTLDAMADDEELLATNLISLGYHLNELVIGLFNVLRWMPLVEQIVHDTPSDIKQGRRTDFSSVRPNSWAASDSNMKYQCMSHMFADGILGKFDTGDYGVASVCAEFVVSFFRTLKSDTVMWFLPIEKE